MKKAAQPSKKAAEVEAQSEARKVAFLEHYIFTADITEAAKRAEIERTLHYYWMHADPLYPERFQDAIAQTADAAEGEVYRRGMHGTFKPNTFKGQWVYPVIGYKKHPKTGKPMKTKPIYGKQPLGVREKSDKLLEFYLKCRRPDVWGNRSNVEVSGAVETNLKFKGTMEDLLNSYRDITLGDATA